jgi:hypothetical protein
MNREKRLLLHDASPKKNQFRQHFLTQIGYHSTTPEVGFSKGKEIQINE